MRRSTGNWIALSVAAATTLLLAEAGVRLFWSDAPVSVGRSDTLPLRQVRDPDILYRLVPGSHGWYNGTLVDVNSLGLRDREYAAAPPAGTSRILVLGDSMVFGIGLAPEQTLPGRLTSLLRPAEAINAGIFGYNLKQEISLLQDVGPAYQPDIVAACFVHNDIENWGLGEGGAVPEIKSSSFEPPPPEAWSTRLADLMLPDPFDPDRLNLLPRGGEGRGLRDRLASWSRLYLFTYLRLRTHSWSLSGGENRSSLLGSPACQAAEVIWKPLRQDYRRLKQTAAETRASLVVVILGGWMWEGSPLEKLLRLLAEESIPVLDLTPVWFDREFYARHYSLGWDPHPNARANNVAAELLVAFLERGGLLAGAGTRPAGARSPAPHEVIEARPDLEPRLETWSRRQEALLAEERTSWRDTVSRFSSEVKLGPGLAGTAAAAQVLYGFWDPEDGPPPPVPEASGRWMSRRGAVLLGNRPGASSVVLEIAGSGEEAALSRTPSLLKVTLSVPPGRCAAATFELPTNADPGRPHVLKLEIPSDLRGAEPLEVELSVDQAFAASYLRPGARDARLVSFFVSLISLE
jgi:lysophospholipase L1-like esterase